MKKHLHKHWPLLGIGGLLILVAIYLAKGYREFGQGRGLPDVFSQDGIKLADINFSQSRPDDSLKWDLDAKEVRLSKDRQFIYFKDFQLRLERAESPSLAFEGRCCDYDQNAGEASLYGNLRGSTNDGYRIATERLSYKQKEGLLTTEDPVQITGPFFSVSGRGLHFDLEKEKLQILSGVTTLIDGRSLAL